MYIIIENNKITQIHQYEVENSFYFSDDVFLEVGWNVDNWKDGLPVQFSSPPPILTEEETQQLEYNLKSDEVRKRRDYLLQETDWIVIKAVDTQTSIPEEWKVYRQALRDITLHPNFPNLEDTDWPVKSN